MLTISHNFRLNNRTIADIMTNNECVCVLCVRGWRRFEKISSPTDIAGQGSYIYKRKKLRGKEEDSSGIDINGGFILNISLSILIADTGNSRIRQLYFETEVEAQEEPTVANTTTPTNNAPYSCKICKCLLQQGARQTLVNVSTIQLETTKYTERDIYRISGYI